jgi:adenylate cyclase
MPNDRTAMGGRWPTQRHALNRKPLMSESEMGQERVQRRLAVILAADVVGYSALMERAEEGTYAEIGRIKREIIDPHLARYQGRLIKTTGDGMLAEFASPLAAVRCAVEIQDCLTSTADALQLRIGLNLGDVIVQEDGDVYGESINTAARLESIADPGGIVISSKVHSEVEGKLDLSFEDRGERRLKNIVKPVRVYAIGAKVRTQNFSLMSPASRAALLPLPDKPSIAVLPFQNMSGDSDQEYFADGFVEDILTALSRFKSLFVIARNSSFTYKGKPVNIRQVGRELGVRYVLEGSVRKMAGRVRITGQLIEASTGRHLWADKFDGELHDIFDLQDKVTSDVVATIAPTIEQAEIERSKRKTTGHLDSYDLFLRGMAVADRRSTASKALELFNKAIALDKEFAAAYAMAAHVALVEQAVSGSPLSVQRCEQAVRFAERAVRLGHDDAFVLARSAHVLAYLGRKYDRAELLAERAVVLNSNCAPAWHSRGWVAAVSVLPERALQSFQQMMRLSPLDPLTVGALYGSSFAYFLASRYEEGLAAATRAIQMAANVLSLAAFIVNAISLRRSLEATDAATHLLKVDRNFRIGKVDHIFPARSADAKSRIEWALRESGLPK